MTFAISSLYYFNVKELQVKSEPVWQTRVKTNVFFRQYMVFAHTNVYYHKEFNFPSADY